MVRRAAVGVAERGRRQKEGTWLVSEGADPGKFSHTMPIAKAMEDVIVAYGQNGEPLRAEQGYPIRLIVPGWEAPFSIKYLSHIKLVDQPYNTWNESMNHSMLRPDIGWQSALVPFPIRPEIRDHAAFGRPEAAKGYVEITGLAWSGGGVVTKVDISTDGGSTWKEAKLQTPVIRGHIPGSPSIGPGTGRRQCCCRAAPTN